MNILRRRTYPLGKLLELMQELAYERSRCIVIEKEIESYIQTLSKISNNIVEQLDFIYGITLDIESNIGDLEEHFGSINNIKGDISLVFKNIKSSRRNIQYYRNRFIKNTKDESYIYLIHHDYKWLEENYPEYIFKNIYDITVWKYFLNRYDGNKSYLLRLKKKIFMNKILKV